MKHFLLHNASPKLFLLALSEKNDNEFRELRLKIDMNLKHAIYKTDTQHTILFLTYQSGFNRKPSRSFDNGDH